MTNIARMAALADARAGKKKDRASSGAAKRDKVGRVERTADAVKPSEKVAAARAAVSGMAPAGVKFLMKIDGGMSDWLEGERRVRGLRSRIATILAILTEARGGK